jgi:RNA polymerase sigma factor (sigma-70 family)
MKRKKVSEVVPTLYERGSLDKRYAEYVADPTEDRLNIMLLCFRTYAKRILIKAGYLRQLGNLDDAIQEASIKLWQSLGAFDVSQSKFSSLANRIAKNAAVDDLERLKGPDADDRFEIIVDDSDNHEEYETQVAEFEELEEEHLSGEDSVLIHLFRAGWTRIDIAKFFKKKDMWVKKRLETIKNKLKKCQSAKSKV